MSQFGYPGLDGPELQPETTLDVKRLLSNHTRIQYAGYSGVQLPESYNGLGFRNLLFILLQIVGFHRAYHTAANAPGVHIVFIEEPEAHLHPQMQEVFIRHLGEIAAILDRATRPSKWPVQFVVSTHSSHVANEAPFEAIRYFSATSKDQPAGVRHTKIKDLRAGLSGLKLEKPKDILFLHQYLTLTRCDLFFADKAVLIEGTSERLMLPKITAILDAADASLKLSSQYTAIIEVGGAYAHLFFPLLDFLELRSLIITDIDATKRNTNNRYEACAVHEGERTSNACLKSWFEDDITPAALIAKGEPDKIVGIRRIAFQQPEVAGGPCGRTFEDAFMLANRHLFPFAGPTWADLEGQARDSADEQKKSSFALEYAILKTGWGVPKYISDGLKWLAGGSTAAVIDSGLTMVADATGGNSVGAVTSEAATNG